MGRHREADPGWVILTYYELNHSSGQMHIPVRDYCLIFNDNKTVHCVLYTPNCLFLYSLTSFGFSCFNEEASS